MARDSKPSNPFQFGNPVAGDYYLPRVGLSKTVGHFLESRIHVVLIGPRRFGKTSFCLNLLQELECSGKTALYVDIFNVTSHRDFLLQWLRALKTKQSFGLKLKKWIQTVPKLKPKFTWTANPQTGELEVGLSTEGSRDEDPKETIQDLLGAVQKLGKDVIVCIDEFQKVAELEDKGWLEATLRTQMQQTKNVAFLFTGSKKSIISDMLNNSNRPFYRSCQPIEFPAFGDEFSEWIEKRFKKVGISCQREAIGELRKQLQETPNYVQMACFHLVAQGYTHSDARAVTEVLRTIVRQNAYAYQTLLNTLTGIQQRALRLCANNSEQVFSSGLLEKYEIPSAPTLHSAIKALKDKQILDEGTAKGHVFFDDPLFAIWLRAEFSL